MSTCVKTFLSILSPRLDLNGECWADWSGGASTLRSHSVALPSNSTPVYFSVFLPVTVFHLTPCSPATCLSTPSQLSFCLSSHRPISYSRILASPPTSLKPVMPGPSLLCQCVWLKCGSRRNKKKICDENFIASALCSWCSDFPLPVVSGSSRHVSLWVFLDRDAALLAAELYKISAWFLVN